MSSFSNRHGSGLFLPPVTTLSNSTVAGSKPNSKLRYKSNTQTKRSLHTLGRLFSNERGKMGKKHNLPELQQSTGNEERDHSLEDQTSNGGSRIFLKDIKTFIGLRKASLNCVERKRQSSVVLSQKRKSALIEMGKSKREILMEYAYSTNKEQMDNIDATLSNRLYGVMNQLETEHITKKDGMGIPESSF